MGPLSASASSLLRTLRCCIVAFLPLFAKTSEAGRCVSLFFNWKWRMAGEKHTQKNKKKKKTSLSHDLSEALPPASQACWVRPAAKLLIQSPRATLQGILGATLPHFPQRYRENKRENAAKIGQSAAGWLYLPLSPQFSEWKNWSGAVNSSFSRSSQLPPVNPACSAFGNFPARLVQLKKSLDWCPPGETAPPPPGNPPVVAHVHKHTRLQSCTNKCELLCSLGLKWRFRQHGCKD